MPFSWIKYKKLAHTLLTMRIGFSLMPTEHKIKKHSELNCPFSSFKLTGTFPHDILKNECKPLEPQCKSFSFFCSFYGQ